MKTSNLFLIVLLAVIALAFYTNPNDAAHKLAFKTKCKDYLEKKVGNKIPETDDLYLNIGKKLGSILGNSVIDEIIDEKVSCQSYGVFSLTKVNWEGKDEIVGYGLLGKVIISDKFEEVLDSKIPLQ